MFSWQHSPVRDSDSATLVMTLVSMDRSLTHGVAESGGGKRRERERDDPQIWNWECFLPLLTERCRSFTHIHTHTHKARLDLTVGQSVIANLLICPGLYEELPLKVSHRKLKFINKILTKNVYLTKSGSLLGNTERKSKKMSLNYFCNICQFY